MDIKFKQLIDARKTGERMHKMVEKHYLDMAPWASCSLIEIFDIIKKLPFQPDPPGMELIKRPLYTMEQIGPGGDCDDKAIALASWAKLNGIPYNFVGVGRKKPGVKYPPGKKINLTHVFAILKIDNKWIFADCTYSHNILGQVLGGYDRKELLHPHGRATPQRIR